MAFYHISFLDFLYFQSPINILDESVGWFARGLFLFLFGLHYKAYQNKFITKFLKLAIAAMLVSVASFFYDSSYVIYFGVLHFFTLSSVIFFCGRRLVYYLGFLSILLLLVKFPTLSHDYLMPIGLVSNNFKSFDYFPLFPFYNFVFLGVLFYDFVIDKKVIGFDLPKSNIVTWFASNSLYIYLFHVPIILLVRYMKM